MYADDLALVVAAKDQDRIHHLLQADLHSLSTWCQSNKLTVNVAKTHVMWCHSPRKHIDTQDTVFKLNGLGLTTVTEYNYLGVSIDRYLTLKSQAAKVINLVRSRLGQLRNIRNNTDAETTVKVYVSMVRPIMEYCSFVSDGGTRLVWTQNANPTKRRLTNS